MTLLKALTIAGSDSGAGSGVQADLKTFAALGVYGTSAITAVTAQNTRKVEALTCLPVSLVISQIRAVLSDIGAQAIKTGMLGSPEIAQAVASTLSDYSHIPLVVDPVMAAESGATLMEEGTLDVLRHQLLSLARVVTPNLPEAAALTGRTLQSESDYRRAIKEIYGMGPRFVVLKGGHRPEPESGPRGREVIDLVYDGTELHTIRGSYLEGGSRHGTGMHPFGSHHGRTGQGMLRGSSRPFRSGVPEPSLAALLQGRRGSQSPTPFLFILAEVQRG